MLVEKPVDAAQRQALQRRADLVDRLAALPDVKKQDSRFEGEITLVAESVRRAEVCALVEAELGPAAKPADGVVTKELKAHPLLEAIGGLRADQSLYLVDLGDGLNLYVAFWPWGGGAKFTIKIGVYERRMPPELPDE